MTRLATTLYLLAVSSSPASADDVASVAPQDFAGKLGGAK